MKPCILCIVVILQLTLPILCNNEKCLVVFVSSAYVICSIDFTTYSRVYDGNLGGIEGANAKCQALASGVDSSVAAQISPVIEHRINRGKKFVAFLSTPSRSAASILTRGDLSASSAICLPDGAFLTEPQPVETRGTLIATGFIDFLDGDLVNPINKDQNNNVVTADTVYTGSNQFGLFPSNGVDCSGWTSNVPVSSTVGPGSTEFLDSRWAIRTIATGIPMCNVPRHLYCIEDPFSGPERNQPSMQPTLQPTPQPDASNSVDTTTPTGNTATSTEGATSTAGDGSSNTTPAVTVPKSTTTDHTRPTATSSATTVVMTTMTEAPARVPTSSPWGGPYLREPTPSPTPEPSDDSAVIGVAIGGLLCVCLVVLAFVLLGRHMVLKRKRAVDRALGIPKDPWDHSHSISTASTMGLPTMDFSTTSFQPGGTTSIHPGTMSMKTNTMASVASAASSKGMGNAPDYWPSYHNTAQSKSEKTAKRFRRQRYVVIDHDADGDLDTVAADTHG